MPTPAICHLGRNVREYQLTSGQTFVEGALVLLVAAGTVSECGADPTQVLGFALHDAGALPNTSIILVAVANEGSTFWISGTANPALADIGDSYGAAKHSDGEWILDKAETTAKVFKIVDVDLTRNLYEVSILPAVRQFAGVA